MFSSSKFNETKIGFIGLGAIGKPMAKNLHIAGFILKVYNRTIDINDLEPMNISQACSSPIEVASDIDVLAICLPDEKAVEEVIFGDKGAINSLAERNIIVDFSTISPDSAKSFSSRCKQYNIDYIDAPVTGGTEGAINGSLSILLGGNYLAVEKIRPILSILGNNIHFFGESGSGQKVKAVNQVLVAGAYASLAEAIVLAQSLELPMEQVISSLSKGAGSSWALKNRSISMINDYYPLGFKLSLHNKDLDIALKVANRLGLDLAITKQIKLKEEELISLGYGDHDLSVLRKSFD